MAMKCDKCNSEMEEIDRREVMVELPEGATEGEIADYTAAQESGDYGKWGATQVTYKCKKCGYTLVEEQV